MDPQKAQASNKARSSNPSRPETSQSRHTRQSSQGRPSYEISKPLPLSPTIPQHPLPSTRYPADTRTPRVPGSALNDRHPTVQNTTRTSRNPSQSHTRTSSEPSQTHTFRVPRAASNERPQGATTTRSVTPSRVNPPQAPAKRSLDLPQPTKRSLDLPLPSTTRAPRTPTNERPQAPIIAPTIRAVPASPTPARVSSERPQATSSRTTRVTLNARPQAPVTTSTRRQNHPWQPPARNTERPPVSPTIPTSSTRAATSSSTRVPTRAAKKAPTAPLPAPPVPPPAAPSLSKEPRSPSEAAHGGGQVDLEAKRNARRPKERVTLRLLRPLSRFSRKSNIPPEGYNATGRPSHEKGMEDLPSFMPWRPLPGPKVRNPEEEKFRRTMRKRRIRILVISGIFVLLLITTIILLVRIVRPHILDAESTLNSHASGSLSQAQQKCLDDFRNQAPSDPTSYSCSTCLPVLRGVSQEYLDSASNANNTNSIHSGIQFCGLKAIFDSSSQDGHGSLTSAGWFRDTNTCNWGGVTCDGSGSINALSLHSPSAPQTIPDDISALTLLSQLEIVGDNSSPIGQIKSSMPSSLRNLTLINTSLAGFENDSLFQQGGSLSKLQILTMDGNPGMGASLPTPIANLPLQSLIVRNQNLNMDLGPLFSSFSLASTLTTLDLSHNGLSGNVPFIVFSDLTTLDLSFNNFQSLSPQLTFPLGLQTLSFQNNTGLQGNISSTLCTSSRLSACSFQSTGFSSQPNITCGTCRF